MSRCTLAKTKSNQVVAVKIHLFCVSLSQKTLNIQDVGMMPMGAAAGPVLPAAQVRIY